MHNTEAHVVHTACPHNCSTPFSVPSYRKILPHLQGCIQSGVIPKFSLCSDGVKWFESKGRFRDGSYTPVAGDIIFFDWGNNGTIDHVGIVESVSGGTVNTIEGNSGDKVARRSYRIGSSNIYGYGVPAY